MQKNKESIEISVKDQKVLWGRSAGRCSFSSCRKELTLVENSPDAKTLGAMCHIVGEKPAAPRGKSSLTHKERNTYSNLILLCSHHHDIVDKSEKIFPIERLHLIKANHELWVTERLGTQVNPDDLVYADLIDRTTSLLQLDRWGIIVDLAVCDQLPVSLCENQIGVNQILLSTIWPQKHPNLKSAIIRLLQSFDEYIRNFMANVEPHLSGKLYVTDKTFRRHGAPATWREFEIKEDIWSKINFWLFNKYVNDLNDFADMVRKHINPLYYLTHGRFLIFDSLGHRTGDGPAFVRATNAQVKRELRKLKYQIKK